MIISFKHHNDDNDSKLQLMIEYCVLATYCDITILKQAGLYKHIQYTYSIYILWDQPGSSVKLRSHNSVMELKYSGFKWRKEDGRKVFSESNGLTIGSIRLYLVTVSSSMTWEWYTKRVNYVFFFKKFFYFNFISF